MHASRKELVRANNVKEKEGIEVVGIEVGMNGEMQLFRKENLKLFTYSHVHCLELKHI